MAKGNTLYWIFAAGLAGAALSYFFATQDLSVHERFNFCDKWADQTPTHLPNMTTQHETLAQSCTTVQSDSLKEDIDISLLLQLDQSRNILPNDLSKISHWSSLQVFEDDLDEANLSTSTRHHLLAKAQIFFRTDFVAALEELFSAMQSAPNEERIEILQGEINALIEYVKIQYFSENQVVPIDVFTQLMNLANEKQPNSLPVLIALVRHHLLVGEYDLAENYIERVPPDIDNLATIDLLNQRLRNNMEANLSSSSGIPLKKLDNHFIVEVQFNDDATLNLMIDTGASRTVMSPQTMLALRRISNSVTDLDITGFANTANGIARTKLYQTESIRVGDYQLNNPLILVSKLPDNSQFDGLLGMDFLTQFEFRIDHQNKRLYLSH